MIDWKRGKDLLWYRNMKERWKKFNVEILSDYEMPIEGMLEYLILVNTMDGFL